jgi:hypothetical protein
MQDEMRLEAHKQKMMKKAKRRDLWHRSVGTPLIMANISQNHMDYGMSPAEHLRAKQERLV